MTAMSLLRALTETGDTLRRTSIMDNDFPERAHRFDSMLMQAKEFLKGPGTDSFAEQVAEELASARKQHARPQASLHEGYAVLAEEVDEVWEIVKQKASRRDHKKLREELVQVAAMAQRMAEEAGL